MDSGVAMILPKGIVVNTKNIYQEVASYPIVPATKIWEYWHGMLPFLPGPKRIGEELAYAVLAALGLVTYIIFCVSLYNNQQETQRSYSPPTRKLLVAGLG